MLIRNYYIQPKFIRSWRKFIPTEKKRGFGTLQLILRLRMSCVWTYSPLIGFWMSSGNLQRHNRVGGTANTRQSQTLILLLLLLLLIFSFKNNRTQKMEQWRRMDEFTTRD